jgi:hypothetical protein
LRICAVRFTPPDGEKLLTVNTTYTHDHPPARPHQSTYKGMN